MPGVLDPAAVTPAAEHLRVPERSTWGWMERAAIGIAVAAVVALIVLVAYWDPIMAWLPDVDGTTLRWLAALLPGAIVINHMIYLLSARRKQFVQALGPASKETGELAELYFGKATLTARYVLPSIMAAVLCAMSIAALTRPATYLPWLWAPMAAPAGEWPTATGWGADVLRGASLGFLGAYLYVLLLLSDRARQRDVTTGVAVWAAAMPVLGPLVGGTAALLLRGGAGPSDGSFSRDAVFFVAGMLPQQFATFVQSGVRKMFQGNATTAIRTMPLTLLRGVGPQVEARLAEEGIHDVSALAYASPYHLIRSTTFAPKQIADWIDEALLIATVPSHWDALEKVGVTGAMDLAWYAAEKNRASIAPLATEIKITESLLVNIIDRLDSDAQVNDLRKLYWDDEAKAARPAAPATGVTLNYDVTPELERDARDRLVAELRGLNVRSADLNGDRLTLIVDPAHREAVEAVIRNKKEINAAQGN